MHDFFPCEKVTIVWCRSYEHLICFWFSGLDYFLNVFLPLFQYIHSNPRRLMNHMKGLHIMCAYSICILGGKLIFSVDCYPSLFLENFSCWYTLYLSEHLRWILFNYWNLFKSPERCLPLCKLDQLTLMSTTTPPYFV